MPDSPIHWGFLVIWKPPLEPGSAWAGALPGPIQCIHAVQVAVRKITGGLGHVHADGSDFLMVKETGTIAGAGTAPALAANTYGIEGNARPH